tara:strand:+ start:420 stop:650 length:231 start_codon:yes stop_codon:yes gene_type:complete
LSKKKATKKEIETVISNMIREIEFVGRKLYELNITFGLYLEWKKDKDKFDKFVKKEIQNSKQKLKQESKSEPGEEK